MHIIKKRSTILGFTFIELLAALIINVILLAGLIAMITQNLNNYNLVIQNNNLSQQLQVAMNMMINDIRRAGYWANAKNDIGTLQNNNPFMVAGTTDLTITGGNCIQFTYDRNSTGTLPSIVATSDDDRYGYRLINNTLQTRPAGASFSCSAASSAWENVTDPSIISITALSFSLSSASVPISGTNTMTVRAVTISITGQLVSNSAITRTMTMVVRIRNDKFA